MQSIFFLGSFVSSPVQMAGCVQTLEMGSLPPIPLEDIAGAAQALAGLNRQRASAIANGMARAEIALARDNRSEWEKARLLIKTALESMQASEWTFLAANYKRTPLPNDAVPPSVLPFFETLTESRQRPLDLEAVQEWPPNSGQIQVLGDPLWRPMDQNPGIQKITIQDIHDASLTAFACDKISGTPIVWIHSQCQFLDQADVTLTINPKDSHAFPIILFEAAVSPDVTSLYRFLIRTYRHRNNGRHDNEDYWTAIWGIPPGKEGFELIVRVDDEIFLPFKDFVRHFLYTAYDNGHHGLYVFEPADIVRTLKDWKDGGIVVFSKTKKSEPSLS